MKQFSLDEYLKNPNKKVVTRTGIPVKIHCTNFVTHRQVIAEIDGSGCSESFSREGRYYNDIDNSSNDLFFAPEKHEGWINLYKNLGGFIVPSRIYQTKEDAEKRGNVHDCYVVTAKIEWEE